MSSGWETAELLWRYLSHLMVIICHFKMFTIFMTSQKVQICVHHSVWESVTEPARRWLVVLKQKYWWAWQLSAGSLQMKWRRRKCCLLSRLRCLVPTRLWLRSDVNKTWCQVSQQPHLLHQSIVIKIITSLPSRHTGYWQHSVRKSNLLHNKSLYPGLRVLA